MGRACGLDPNKLVSSTPRWSFYQVASKCWKSYEKLWTVRLPGKHLHNMSSRIQYLFSSGGKEKRKGPALEMLIVRKSDDWQTLIINLLNVEVTQLCPNLTGESDVCACERTETDRRQIIKEVQVEVHWPLPVWKGI